jgi:hypothetical protein
MRELQGAIRTLRFDKRIDPREHLDVLVFPYAEVELGDAAARFDCGRFRKDDPGAADRAAPQVNQVPIGGESVFGGVLAHRGHGDAIANGDTA